MDRPRSRRYARFAGLLALTVLVGVYSVVVAQQIRREGFEGLKTAWVKSGADAPFEEKSHVITDQGAHDGQRAEYLQLEVKPGGFIHYQYSTGKVPVTDEMTASVWLKSNRPGAQVLARVVLPNEPDPQDLNYRLTTYIRGEEYRNAGRWQRLEIGRPMQLSKQQQQMMQVQLQRAVNFEGAYVDAIVLNLYAGPGPTEVWIDDLEYGPVAPETPAAPPALGVLQPKSTGETPRAGMKHVVEFNNNQLLVGGKQIIFRGIRNSDTPLRALRDAGFNTVFFDYSTQAAQIQEAIDLGFWIVPQLKVLSDDPKLSSSEGITREVNRYMENDGILFYHLGGTLSFEQSVPMSRAAQVVRQADPGRPIAADVWDGLLPYSRTLNLLGVYRWPLMTTLEMPMYREWLEQRRRLANPGTFMWTWIQTHVPEWYSQLLYERSSGLPFDEPVGPQAEQIRLLSYTALASGYKGLGFWSDRFLADSHQGRDRLLCCALLNQEIEMLEPLLVTADDSPQWVDTSVADVKAAVMRTGKGILVLPIWQGKGSQFVPGQAAANKLTIVVPQVPQSMQCWQVSPGVVQSVRMERVVGGTKITLPEFGLTEALVFTSDNSLLIRFQEQARNRRKLAAQWTYDMALYEMEKVLKVEEQLEKRGHAPADAKQLIDDTQVRLHNAKEFWDNRMFGEAYLESQRALRPLRILMRSQWDMAVKGLDTPVASQYAVSFFTLPRHWDFMDQIGRGVPAPNVLPGGDFEIIPERVQESWKIDDPTLDDVELLAQRVSEIPLGMSIQKGTPTNVELPRQGKQCAMLQIKAKNKLQPPQALEKTLLAITSPQVKLQPGTLVQVSGWIRIPEEIKASPDGALFYDSAGGEPLAVRLTQPTPWKKFTLYRRVPATGKISVTLAMTGIGTVYFDDVRIEPLVSSDSRATIIQTGAKK